MIKMIPYHYFAMCQHANTRITITYHIPQKRSGLSIHGEVLTCSHQCVCDEKTPCKVKNEKALRQWVYL